MEAKDHSESVHALANVLVIVNVLVKELRGDEAVGVKVEEEKNLNDANLEKKHHLKWLFHFLIIYYTKPTNFLKHNQF